MTRSEERVSMGRWIGTMFVVLALASGCTDVGLQPKPAAPPRTFDNLLRIKGQFCAQPNQTVVFPVKVLFLLDQSASLQCTDSTNKRYAALNDLIAQLYRSSSTYFGFVGFSSWSRELAFTRDMAAISRFTSPSAGLGPATDYQGALATGLRILEQDMLATAPAERARTRYVVVFVSDGVAEPRCNAGCEDARPQCMDRMDNDGDSAFDGADSDCANIGNNTLHPDNLYGVCNIDPMDLEEARMRDPMGETTYADFDGVCPAYNQPPQIMARVGDILALQDEYATGDITLNTVLLFSPQAVVEGVCPGAGAMFGYDQAQARATLTGMATAGRGIFRDANTSSMDDTFLDFDFRSLEAPESFTGLQIWNAHARNAPSGLEEDSDTDGIPDSVEFAAGMNPRNPDSDVRMSMPAGDSYNDLLEMKYRERGFDPLDPDAPVVPCGDRSDLDGDGLRACEEAVLETDPRSSDSDGDHMLDRIELINGTNPLRDDSAEDLDFDGILNREETLAGTNPSTPDARDYRDHRIAYDVVDVGEQMVTSSETRRTELRHCYSFEARNIRMVSTPLPANRGLNRILIYTQEQPAQLAGARSQTRVACFEAFYVGETSKIPEDGVIDASVQGWQATIDALQTQLDGLEACPGWFGPGFGRNVLESAVNRLPEPIVLGRFGYSRMTLIQLLQHYFTSGNAVRLPQPSSELFVPIELFDPAQHCYRPWELDRIRELLDLFLAQCRACEDGTSGDSGVVCR